MTTTYSVGTVTVANGGTTVTGVGTSWKGKVFEGDLFTDPAQGLFARVTADATSNTSLSINAWPGVGLTAAPYEVLLQADSIRGSERTRLLLEKMSVVEANGRGLFYLFSDSVTDADPGAGYLRLNHGTISSATAGYLDNLDANGATVSAILDTWDAAEAAIKGQLSLRSVADPATFHAFNVTGSVVDGTGYRKLTLAYVGGSGTFAANDELMAMFSPSGDDGLTGTLPQGRLTLATGVPLPTSDIVGATSIYYTPALGSKLSIWDGTQFLTYEFTELTLPLDANSGHSNYHIAGLNYDLFAFNDAGTIRLGTGPRWGVGAVPGSTTARGSGAGSTELETKKGILTNKNVMNIRYGANSGDVVTVPANKATFLGSVTPSADGQATDSADRRLLSNAYNTALRPVRRTDAAATVVYSTAALAVVNGDTNNRVEVLFCLGGMTASIKASALVASSSATIRTVDMGIGSTASAFLTGSLKARSNVSSTVSSIPTASFDGVAGMGLRPFYWIYVGAGTDTQTWYLNGTLDQVGMAGVVVN
jgi:hypothetical protein